MLVKLQSWTKQLAFDNCVIHQQNNNHDITPEELSIQRFFSDLTILGIREYVPGFNASLISKDPQNVLVL